MQAAKRVAKNTAILYGRMAITMFISLYATRLVLAALGASDFGIFNVVGGAIVMLTFLNNAMAASTQRFMSYAHGEENPDKQKNIFNVSIVLHLLIGILIVILLEVAGYFLFHNVLKIAPERLSVAKLIYHFLVLSTFVRVISVPYDAVINAHEDMLFVAILGIFEAFLKLGIAFYVTYTGFDKLASYGFFMAMLAILLLLIQRLYCHRRYIEVKINIRKYYDKTLFKEMTSFGGWSLLGSTTGLLSNYGQGIVINMFFGTIVNAAQGVANQIAGQLSAFSSTMLKALNPVIVKSEGSGNREAMLRVSMTGSKISFSLMAFFSIPVILEMPLILNFWLKSVPEYAIIFCRLLLIKTLIEQLFVTLSTSIAAAGNIKRFQISLSLLAVLPLIVTYFLFKAGYSPETIYIVFIIQVLIRSFGVILYFAKKLCGLSIGFFLKDVIFRNVGITLISSAIILIPYYLIESGLKRLILIAISYFVIYFLLFYFSGLNRYEKEIVRTGINSGILKLKKHLQK